MTVGAGGVAVDVVSSPSILLRHDRVLGGGRCLRQAARAARATAGAVSVVAFVSSCRLGRRMSRMLLVGERRRARGVG